MDKNSQTDDAEDWDAEEYTRKYAAESACAQLAPIAPIASIALPQPATTPSQRAKSSGTNYDSRAVPHRRYPKNFPGFIARSAMFRASTSNDEFDQKTVIKAQKCTLTFSGPKLGMRDKQVWEAAIQVAKERAGTIGDAFEIELRDLARRMGSKNQGAKALSSIWNSLEKLARCRVEFELGNSCKGIGSLLSSAFRDSGRIYLRLNADFAFPALLGDKQFAFDQSRRASLPSALSQWLHDFFSTHDVPKEMDLLYLRELCGYDGCAKNFPGKLRAAMKALVDAAPSLVASFELDEVSRCSDDWKLRVIFGPEKPSFRPAERIDQRRKTGRGGVSL